jgi:hypothetical protein
MGNRACDGVCDGVEAGEVAGAVVPLTIWDEFDLLYSVLVPHVVKERLFRFFPEAQTNSISLNSALL